MSVEGHNHKTQSFHTAFIIGIGLNITYVVLEALAGWKYNSLALLSDAGHNLSDVGTLLLAWFAISISKRKLFCTPDDHSQEKDHEH